MFSFLLPDYRQRKAIDAGSDLGDSEMPHKTGHEAVAAENNSVSQYDRRTPPEG
ncbi:hypothetical protein [Natrinema sp. DC36]|uniref:hypothetical protein n=1 Tax=Natrinema sp. DC36 TaxID=2878680 RepID=UPI001CEFBEDF|nr:hypothetical protein [Natrinema sp. DC36]